MSGGRARRDERFGFDVDGFATKTRKDGISPLQDVSCFRDFVADVTGLKTGPTYYAEVDTYSVRSARMGEIDAARPAGTSAAMSAQAASDVAAVPRASGSQNDTP